MTLRLFFDLFRLFFLVILDVFRVFSVCSQATGHTLWPRHLIGNMIFVTISRIIIKIYVLMQSACRISYTTMYKNIRFRWTRHLLTASIWCGLWGCWYGPSDAYFLYYDSLLPSTSTLLGAIVQSYTCVRHVNQWGPTKQYYMFSMDTEQNQPPRIPLEPSKMRFRSHLNVCNSLASHALPWPFTRHKVKLLKL